MTKVATPRGATKGNAKKKAKPAARKKAPAKKVRKSAQSWDFSAVDDGWIRDDMKVGDFVRCNIGKPLLIDSAEMLIALKAHLATAQPAPGAEGPRVIGPAEQPWDSLESLQKRFCEEFTVDLNQTKAYMRVYGCKETAAAASASALLRNPKVRGYVDHLLAKIREQTRINAARVLDGFANIAFADIRKIFGENGELLDPRSLPDDLACAIQGVEVFEEFEGAGKDRTFVGYTKKYKMADRSPALVNLGKYLKLFVEQMEVTGKDGGPVQHQAVPDDYSHLEAKLAKRQTAVSR